MMKIEGRTSKDMPLSQEGILLGANSKEAASASQLSNQANQNLKEPQIIGISGSDKNPNQNSNKAMSINVQAHSEKREGQFPQQMHKHKSKSAQHQRRSNKKSLNKTISAFDKLEEARYKSYETHQTLQQIVNLVDSQQHQQVGTTSFVTLSKSTWNSMNQLCQDLLRLFAESSQEWDSLVEKLASEVNEYKVLCHRMKAKLELTKKERFDQRRQNELSLKDLARAYSQNQTQYINQMDQIEIAILDKRHAIQERNIKQMSYISQLDKVIEEVMSEIDQNSGQFQASHTGNCVSSRNSILGVSDLAAAQRHPQLTYQTSEETRVVTPRTQQQILSARRGRSQQPLQKEQNCSRVDVLPPQHPNVERERRVNIPLLPIHMINNNGVANQESNRAPAIPQISSHRGNQFVNAPAAQSQLSSRRHHQLPPTCHQPGQLSARGSHRSVQPMNQPSARVSSRANSNRMANDSKASLGGALIDGEYIVNPVMLNAVKYQTSKFDNKLEDDFDGADETMPLETERLKQFEEEYQMLMEIEDENQRILVKEYMQLIHEKELKMQVKQEKLIKRQQRQALRQQQMMANQQTSFDGTTPRGSSFYQRARNNENDQTLKEPSADNYIEQIKEINDSDLKNNDISLNQSKLSLLKTNEMLSARRKEIIGEVQLNQLLDVRPEISEFLKSVTEKDILLKIEEDFKQREELLKEDRKPLGWSSHDDSSSSINDYTPAENIGEPSIDDSRESNKNSLNNLHVQVAGISPIHKLQKGLAKQQVNVIDMAKQNGHKSKGYIQPIPIDMEGLQRKEGIQDRDIKTKDCQQFVFPQFNDDEEEEKMNCQLSNQQSFGKFWSDQYLNANYVNQNQMDQLDIIQERQSELSSSINTNNRNMYKLNSHRSSQRYPNLNNFVAPQSGRRSHRVVENELNMPSARESVYYNNICETNRPKNQGQRQLQQPSGLLNNESGHNLVHMASNDLQIREEKYKRCKSHCHSLQSEPVSQRGKPSQKDIQYRQLLHHQSSAKNFHSIQVEESFEATDKSAQQLKDKDTALNQASNHKRNKRPVTELGQHGLINTLSSGMCLEDSYARNAIESEAYRKKAFARRHSPMINELLCPQHFSSIQNQFDESKNSDFKNESLYLEKGSVCLHNSLKANSDYGGDIREDDELCDFDDIDLSQLQMCSKFLHLAGLRDTEPQANPQIKLEEQKVLNINQSPFTQNRIQQNSQSLKNIFLFNKFNQSNINSSLLLQGNHSNQSGLLLHPTNTQKHNDSHLFQSRGLTGKMILNYLQNLTQFKVTASQLTKEVPTSKKAHQFGDHKTSQIHGQSGFTLSTLGDETLQYMFPYQKTAKRTLFMLQNFHNHYYNNNAGVLFTMPISTGDINNGFLQQCSTVPSAVDPNLCSGVLTHQIQIKQASQHARHNLPQQSQTGNLQQINIGGGTQDSFINKEESSLQRLGFPQFYSNDNHLQKQVTNLSKNNVAALSTGESGTLRSTVQATAPKQSIDIFDKNQMQQSNNQSDLKFTISNNRPHSSNNLRQRPIFKNADQAKDNGIQQIFKRQHFITKQAEVGETFEKQINRANDQLEQQNTSTGRPASFKRNIKLIQSSQQLQGSEGYGGPNFNNIGLFKLQALADNAHNSVVSQGGGSSIIFKKANVIKFQRGSLQQKISTTTSNTADITNISSNSISRLIKQ